MGLKVNIGARIKRHSRILKENILNNKNFPSKNFNSSYKVILFVIIFIIPVYPSLSSFIHSNTEFDFYRGDIDESSIIGSYFGDNIGNINDNSPIFESKDSFLSINTLLNDDRNLSGTNEIIDYEVKSGESVSSIAYKFKVSNQSIYDNNNFSKNHIIHPGDIIKIPPVSGLIHQIKSGETISSIAKKYDVDSNKIMEQNLLTIEDKLIKGNVLVIPGAVKPKPVYKQPPKNNYANSSGGYSFANVANSKYVNTKGVYKLTPKPSFHTFYWGNCTWYVAKYKTVKWGGNAKDWLKNAQNKGFPTGPNPSIGSIVVFHGKGYNPRYGHVGIVMDIQNENIIVSDMNYRKLGEITYRKVPINDRAITGYIYVD